MQRSRFRIGLRNIKTASTVVLCALVYFLLGRNPTFACIGVIFGLGNSMADSRLNGGNRVFGTIIGGVLGMLLFRVYLFAYPAGGHHLLLLPLLFVGVVLLILIGYVIRWEGAILSGGVVLCVVMLNTPAEAYISYSLNRILDTTIGVVLAITVNYLLPAERIHRWRDALLRRKRS